MIDRDTDSGLELVMDNRKLIIAFVVFIAICGYFFVLGFMLGKRQTLQEGTQTAAESAPKTSPAVAQVNPSKPSGPDAGASTPDEKNPQLNWYKNVSRRAGEPEIVPQAAAPSPDKKIVEPADAATAAGKPKTLEGASHPEGITYSVQIGAFRQRHESEVRAKELRSRGYDCRIESPSSANQLFLVKVGKFHSRAEAVAMQLRLKKNGFTSFVKTN